MKTRKLIFVVVITVFAIWISFKILNWTYILSSYRVLTESMSPAINIEDHLLMSRFIKPRVGDVICYRAIYEIDKQEYSFVHRLMALENDTIEMRNGLLYRNGKCADDSLKLKFMYIVHDNNVFSIRKALDIPKDNINIINDSMASVLLTYPELAIAKKYAKNIESTINKNEADPYFYFSNDTLSWSRDSFGPVVIPKGYCFVLGDNRHQSADSRYRGFISIDKVKAVVFFTY